MSALSKVEFVLTKTYKEDKYGRFLVDIFYLPKEADPQKAASEGVFLNQELLETGQASIFVK